MIFEWILFELWPYIAVFLGLVASAVIFIEAIKAKQRAKRMRGEE